MRLTFKTVQNLLNIGISVWMLVFPVYDNFYAMEELDILFPYPCIGNIEEGILPVDQEKILGASASFIIESSEAITFEHIALLFLEVPSVASKVLTLRC
jgi:hypothetical protein